MLSQVAQFAPQFDVEIEEASVDLRATFDSARKYGLPGPGTHFTNVAIRLDIRSGNDPAKIKSLLKHAEMGCHAARSFQEVVPVTLQATLNRESVDLG